MPEQVLILTGEIHSGKTSKLNEWSRTRSDVYGILTPVFEGTRYFWDIHSREQFRMEADDEEEDMLVGKYRFSKNSFNKAIRILEDAMNRSGWRVVDEIGPLELRGEGFAQVVKLILRERKEKVLLVVRKTCVDQVIHYFDLRRDSVRVIGVKDTLPF